MTDREKLEEANKIAKAYGMMIISKTYIIDKLERLEEEAKMYGISLSKLIVEYEEKANRENMSVSKYINYINQD